MNKDKVIQLMQEALAHLCDIDNVTFDNNEHIKEAYFSLHEALDEITNY